MILVMGLGFVGLATALSLGAKGHRVFGYDIDSARLDTINRGEIPFHEPEFLEQMTSQKGSTFLPISNVTKAIAECEVIFVCVGTPSESDGSVDLSYIYSSVDMVLEALPDDNISRTIVIKSTVPPSTALEKILPYIQNHNRNNGKIKLASNPEFLREGKAWEDVSFPDKIVIGAEDEATFDSLAKLYEGFDCRVSHVSLSTAEFAKYLSNTFLATLISFSNEVAMMAKAIGEIDSPRAFELLHADRRWSGKPASMVSYAKPGCGYGGYCLPKDAKALLASSKSHGFQAPLLASVIETNEVVKDFAANEISRLASGDKQIGILGLSFKPDSDDVRESPSYFVIKKLLALGHHRIVAYDPMANKAFRKAFPYVEIEYADSLEEILGRAEIFAVLTGWQEFKISAQKITEKTYVDFRDCLN